MKKLLLHIGPHKTASTYVQSNLVANAARLREKGVCYPRTMLVKPGHHEVVTRLSEPGTDAFDPLLKEVAPYETVVLSTENFTRLEPEQIETLLGLFDGYDIHVLFYYRDFHMLWPSHWQETIKQGGHETWPEYLIKAMGFTEAVFARHLRPHIVLDRWVSALGRDRVHIFPYAAIGPGPLEALAPVCELISVDTGALDPFAADRNASYPPARVEAIRVLNERAAAAGRRPGTDLRRRYMRRAERLEASDLFAELSAHFEAHARKSILRRSDPYLDFMSSRILDAYADLMMCPPPPAAAGDQKVVRFLDAAHRLPNPIADELVARLMPEDDAD
ncbi:hypothetical protein [Jannaschia seohaensis]|uniref:Sulfotransferase family protein n=1 Tax=Jannaschia seohaensis TaxID=475081 RepID=A0A2Y9B2H5_9RHOB|nr:hypothetical protein [Jannaschia seohaensis]PWJ12932.1 hypothetical protein BCF38_11568 [Jannaschia seohaensis]SSA50740.1 hypothetical protein SAMN05421539_11568 [Jannaschia seohaensis]